MYPFHLKEATITLTSTNFQSLAVKSNVTAQLPSTSMHYSFVFQIIPNALNDHKGPESINYAINNASNVQCKVQLLIILMLFLCVYIQSETCVLHLYVILFHVIRTYQSLSPMLNYLVRKVMYVVTQFLHIFAFRCQTKYKVAVMQRIAENN